MTMYADKTPLKNRVAPGASHRRPGRRAFELTDNRPAAIAQRKPGGDAVVQREATVSEKTTFSDTDKDELLGKLHAAAAILNRTWQYGRIDVSLQLSDKNTICPAVVSPEKDGFEAKLEWWWVRGSSETEIVGMLNHEIGVHPLPSRLLSDDEQKAEDEGKDDAVNVELDGKTYTMSSPATHGRRIPGDGDHVNAARLGEGLDQGRTGVYLDLMLSSVDAFLEPTYVEWRESLTSDITEEDNKRLMTMYAKHEAGILHIFKAYLVDLGRFIGADNSMRALFNPFGASIGRAEAVIRGVIPLIYNKYRKKHAWLEIHDAKGWESAVLATGVFKYVMREASKYMTWRSKR